jgi:hypothetical protein
MVGGRSNCLDTCGLHQRRRNPAPRQRRAAWLLCCASLTRDQGPRSRAPSLNDCRGARQGPLNLIQSKRSWPKLKDARGRANDERYNDMLRLRLQQRLGRERRPGNWQALFCRSALLCALGEFLVCLRDLKQNFPGLRVRRLLSLKARPLCSHSPTLGIKHSVPSLGKSDSPQSQRPTRLTRCGALRLAIAPRQLRKRTASCAEIDSASLATSKFADDAWRAISALALSAKRASSILLPMAGARSFCRV